ncbi:MAG: hypothetical protein GQ565_04060 [Candidatus Aegiribacteria sp.]|nr:hypothetical protein [Candidatus Aegiribacteria sp.]
MDILRNSIITLLTIISISSVASSTPIDSTWDLLHVVENRDGERFLGMMSESVRTQIESSYQQLRELVATNPGLAETLLRESGTGLTTWDLEWMNADDFVSRMLEGVYLPPLENIISEEASMRGRNADVLFTWHSGYSLSIQFSWEESSWKITGSPVLNQLFQGYSTRRRT